MSRTQVERQLGGAPEKEALGLGQNARDATPREEGSGQQGASGSLYSQPWCVHQSLKHFDEEPAFGSNVLISSLHR